MNNKLSRRQKAALKNEYKSYNNEMEVKSLFNLTSNNSNLNLNLFDTLMRALSTDAQLSKIVKGNTTLSTCVDIISMKVATIPFNLYRQQKNGEFIPVKGKRHTDHIFSKPNNKDTQITLLYKLVSYFLTYGNAYLVKASNQIFALPPTKVTENKDKGSVISYRIQIDNEQSIEVPTRLVCQIFKPDLDGNYNSAVRNAITDVVLNSEIINQSTNHIKNGMMARGILKQVEGSTSLSSNQMKDLSTQFTNATSGERAAGTPVLPRGIEYVPTQQSAADSSLIELESMTGKKLVKAFKIPESIFNSEAGASFATANIQEINFNKNTIKPLCVLVESFVNYWNEITSETEYFKFDIGELISAEQELVKANTNKVKAETTALLQQIDLYSENELRNVSGFGEIKDSNGQLIEEANTNPVELNDFNLDEPLVGAISSDTSTNSNQNIVDTNKPTDTQEPNSTNSSGDTQLPNILNGAQITSIADLIQLVSQGQIPRDSAINIIMVGFNLTEEQANSMIGSAGQGFKPKPTTGV